MDLISLALVSFFGGAIVGGLIGSLVGHFTRFELGLATGTLIVGSVGLYFSAICLIEYRVFSAPAPNRVAGEIISIEAVAVPSIGGFTPTPRVRYTTADGTTHTVLGPGAGSGKPGDKVTMLVDPADPERVRIGNPNELRNAAIAMMLFGTFPFSFGVYLLGCELAKGRDRRHIDARVAGNLGTPARRVHRELNWGLNVLLAIGILWVGIAPGALEKNFMVGFGLIAFAMFGHGVRGLFDRNASLAWSLGMFVLALNFGVWVVALHLLWGQGA